MTVLILGCGWVGEAFAGYMQRAGYQLWVTTTSKEKAERLDELGFHAVQIDFDKRVDERLLSSSFDYILTSVPATSKQCAEVLSKRFERVAALINKLDYTKHVFLSSVGIYPDRDGVFDEGYTMDLNKRLYDAEQAMLALPDTVVYRLGGLFGRNRIFAKYFENKVCTTGDQLANFVHVDDVVALIEKGLVHLSGGEVYNVVCPEHPSKRSVIEASAARYGYELPSLFEDSDAFQKWVSSHKIIDELGYQFKYSSPLYF